jgi:hypothetical protein
VCGFWSREHEPPIVDLVRKDALADGLSQGLIKPLQQLEARSRLACASSTLPDIFGHFAATRAFAVACVKSHAYFPPGRVFISLNRTVAQVLPPPKKAARIGITQGAALELAHDELAIHQWTPNNPGGSDDHFGCRHLQPEGRNSCTVKC